ncbi:Cleavage and polyadenylation specificity factor subunit 5, partial [Durusdinium trenchii]
MLAFAPMPCVPASLHDMAKMRVGTGQSGQLNFTEETVKVVVSLGEDPKHRGLVRPLVEQLERRMRLLVERDYRSAVASLEGRCQEVLQAFFELVGQEDVEEYGEGGDAAAHEKNSWAQVTPREQLQKKSSKLEARRNEMMRSILSGVLKA